MSRKRIDTPMVPVGPVLWQLFSVHIMHSPESMFKDTLIFEKRRHIALLNWFRRWRIHFYGLTIEAPQVLDTDAQRLTVKKCKIRHPDSVLQMFNAWTICKKEMRGFYYCAIVYADLTKERHREYVCGKGEAK